MSGPEIAAEVAAGIAEAAAATGTGRLTAVLRKRVPAATGFVPGVPDTFTDAAVGAVQVSKTVRDGPAMVRRTVRMLIIDALGVVPTKGDQVAVGFAIGDAVPAQAWERIADVETLEPGGTALMFKATLEG
jgi:hypothetical protein